MLSTTIRQQPFPSLMCDHLPATSSADEQGIRLDTYTLTNKKQEQELQGTPRIRAWLFMKRNFEGREDFSYSQTHYMQTLIFQNT